MGQALPWGQVCGSRSPSWGAGGSGARPGSLGTVACGVDLHHFLFLERKEVKRRRRKEVVAPKLTSATA